MAEVEAAGVGGFAEADAEAGGFAEAAAEADAAGFFPASPAPASAAAGVAVAVVVAAAVAVGAVAVAVAVAVGSIEIESAAGGGGGMGGAGGGWSLPPHAKKKRGARATSPSTLRMGGMDTRDGDGGAILPLALGLRPRLAEACCHRLRGFAAPALARQVPFEPLRPRCPHVPASGTTRPEYGAPTP